LGFLVVSLKYFSKPSVFMTNVLSLGTSTLFGIFLELVLSVIVITIRRKDEANLVQNYVRVDNRTFYQIIYKMKKR
jgi:hypothetical protein